MTAARATSHPLFFILFARVSGLSSVPQSLPGDCQGSYCALPPQSFRPTRDGAYTLGFSPVPVFNSPHGFAHSWKDSAYGTNRPKSRSSVHSFSRTGTLPPYFPQQQRHAGAGGAEMHNQSPNIVTVATELEVATIFWKKKKRGGIKITEVQMKEGVKKKKKL